jgi:hypothetical protein
MNMIGSDVMQSIGHWSVSRASSACGFLASATLASVTVRHCLLASPYKSTRDTIEGSVTRGGGGALEGVLQIIFCVASESGSGI